MKLFIIPIPVPIPAPLFGVAYVAYSWWSAKQARGRINHDAHLGGALFGVVFVALTDPAAFANLLGWLGS
jgi:membrane associated rhomboid family serine protease